MNAAAEDWRASARFPSHPNSVAGARRFALAQLASNGLAAAEQVADVPLIVSELVTNAINSGSPEVDCTLIQTEHELRIEVADTADGTPHEVSPQVRGTHGRGLHIVEQTSDAWGFRPTPPGKTVWAVVRLV